MTGPTKPTNIEKKFIEDVIKKEYSNLDEVYKDGYDIKIGNRKIEVKVREVTKIDCTPPSLEITKNQLDNMKNDDFWIFYVLYDGKNARLLEYKASDFKEKKDYRKVIKGRIEFSDVKERKQYKTNLI